ncbi:MAG: hypothetical protein COB53_05185 [Elusimicrobia bacterium]|nr:MAG: hypothetical protein COB53_05185 [Elusimicrobiota bacterium]
MPRLPHNLPKVILTEDEVARLLRGADLRSPVGVRDRAVLALLYGIAIRTGELIALKISHVDFSERIVYTKRRKGGTDGSVPAPIQTLK